MTIKDIINDFGLVYEYDRNGYLNCYNHYIEFLGLRIYTNNNYNDCYLIIDDAGSDLIWGDTVLENINFHTNLYEKIIKMYRNIKIDEFLIDTTDDNN